MIETNEDLAGNPKLAGTDTYGAGWMVKVKPADWAAAKASLIPGTAVAGPYEAKMAGRFLCGLRGGLSETGAICATREAGMDTADNQKSMTLIVTKGSLDWAYPPFILSTTAAAMGLDVTMFFTFYGLALLKKKLDLQVTTLGNPAMEMPMMGMHMAMPNFVSAIPGVDAAATRDDEEPHQEARASPRSRNCAKWRSRPTSR